MGPIVRAFQALALAGGLLATPVAAQTLTVPLLSDFEDSRYTPFFDDVATGLMGTIEDGAVVVVSQRPPGTGRLTSYGLEDQSPVSVFVDVSAQLKTPNFDAEGQVSGGGILIRRSDPDEPNSFYALLLQSKSYVVIGWVGNGIVQRIGGTLPAGTGQTVRLAASETEDGAEFFVNGTSVARISHSQISGRRAGMVVFGGGAFRFDNFGLNTNSDIGNATTAAPQP